MRLALTLLTCTVVALSTTTSYAVPSPEGTPDHGLVQEVIAEPRPGTSPTGGTGALGLTSAKVRRDASGFTGVPSDTPTTSLTGTHAGSVATDGSREGLAASSYPAALTATGTRNVYVALVIPKGGRADRSMTDAKVRKSVAAASAYWSQQTGGKVTLKVAQRTGWYRSAFTCSDVYGMWSEAQRRMPKSTKAMSSLLVVTPTASSDSPGCPYGFATVGHGSDPGSAYVTELAPTLVTHELGHNLGLNHAGALTCGTKADGAYARGWPATCRLQEYDDLFDVMGFSGPGFGEGNLNGPHVHALGLDHRAVLTVTRSMNVSLNPLSRIGTRRVLRIVERGGAVYFVEWRTASGRDAVASRSEWTPQLGVRILRPDPREKSSTGSLELDATPGGSGAPYARSLPKGRTFVSATGRTRVTFVKTTARTAVLTVRLR